MTSGSGIVKKFYSPVSIAFSFSIYPFAIHFANVTSQAGGHPGSMVDSVIIEYIWPMKVCGDESGPSVGLLQSEGRDGVGISLRQ